MRRKSETLASRAASIQGHGQARNIIRPGGLPPARHYRRSAALMVVKGLAGVVLAAVAWAGFYVTYLIITNAG